MERQATLRDAIYGQAVGDALGVPWEFKARDAFECTDMVGFGTYPKEAGTWSDDTSMCIATCDSIRACDGRIDVDDMRQRFCRWMLEGAYTVDGMFDIGFTTRYSLESGEGRFGQRDNGNGSLMRIIPLAFTDADEDQIEAVSAITHGHAISVSRCISFVDIARRLIAGEDPKDISEIACRMGMPRHEVHSSGFVVHTYDAALWCIANTDNYADCVKLAVNLGEDTDTTAAVAGALAGIIYGIEGIPAEWLETLRGKDVIDATLFA